MQTFIPCPRVDGVGHVSTGTKRQRPWAEEDDEEDEAAAPTEQQIVPRASAGTAWPQLFATEPEVRVVHETGDLPAEAAKTAAAGDSKDFSFIPTSHGVAKAVSPFELSQKEGEQESVHEVSRVEDMLHSVKMSHQTFVKRHVSLPGGLLSSCTESSATVVTGGAETFCSSALLC